MCNSKHNKSRNKKSSDSGFYGLLDNRNIRRVGLGQYEFDTWYGNAAYFSDQNHSVLGYKFHNKQSISGSKNRRTKQESQNLEEEEEYWVDKLYVCEYCFKYTTEHSEIQKHRIGCTYNSPFPKVGKCVYKDDNSKYIIEQVRGFKNIMFCQNLCLFGKLFLEDKSVYYNVDHFDFYVIYGLDLQNGTSDAEYYKPMGFFSKEVLSWDNDNNLACICIFPPYQRRHLGSLLIEFSYALASNTPDQAHSGPEFPLSPYGQISYLNFWSKKLSNVISGYCKVGRKFTLLDLANVTSFRKEDILLTLEYMKLLKKDEQTGEVSLLLGNLKEWCSKKNVDPTQDKSMLNPNSLLI